MIDSPPPTGVLLINLGTPDAPHPAEVRRYLREFLWDPRVITLNPVARWLLLHLVILPFRPRKSAAAYAAIWTPEGSPLLVNVERLARGVQEELGASVPVEFAMRYGRPAVGPALERLRDRGARRLVCVPLYPQYAASSTESSIEKVREETRRRRLDFEIEFIQDFYDHPSFIEPAAAAARRVLEREAFDHVLFSFHGLPESHIRALDATGAHCLERPDCCDRVEAVNRRCYRAQSYATARALLDALELEPDRTSVAFQSRLGRRPWIRPYTDAMIPELAARGVRRLAVVVPSFTADCLETLEEIGIRGREQFLESGGESLTLIPCVNDDPAWVRGLAAMVRERTDRARSEVFRETARR